jgi:hypothetical protein
MPRLRSWAGFVVAGAHIIYTSRALGAVDEERLRLSGPIRIHQRTCLDWSITDKGKKKNGVDGLGTGCDLEYPETPKVN